MESSLASTCYCGYVGNGWNVVEIYISVPNIYEHEGMETLLSVIVEQPDLCEVSYDFLHESKLR